MRPAVAALLCALAAGCPGDPRCPEGSVLSDGRCVAAAPDASADACTTRSFFTDADGDGFGAGEPTEACEAPAGHVARSGDCDDGAAAVHPGAAEACNGIDDDCDEAMDEELAPPLGMAQLAIADPSLSITHSAVAPFDVGYAVAYAVEGKVYVAGFAEDGTPASEPIAVDDSEDGQRRPALVATAEGGLVVVWERSAGGGSALVRARRLDATWVGPAAQTVSSSAADSGAGPAVAYVDGLVTVVWSRADRTGFDGQVLNEAGLSPVGSAVPLLDARLDLDDSAPFLLIAVPDSRPPYVLAATAAPATPGASGRMLRLARLRIRPLSVEGAALVAEDGPVAGVSGGLGAAADGSARAVFTVSLDDASGALVRVAPGMAGGDFGTPTAEVLELPTGAVPGSTATSVLLDGSVDAVLATGVGQGAWWTRIARGEAVVAEELGPEAPIGVLSVARRHAGSALLALSTDEGELWLQPLGCVP